MQEAHKLLVKRGAEEIGKLFEAVMHEYVIASFFEIFVGIRPKPRRLFGLFAAHVVTSCTYIQLCGGRLICKATLPQAAFLTLYMAQLSQ